MQLGIFAKTFPRATLEETLDVVVAHGLAHIQFNMSCAGLPTLPDQLDEATCVKIASALRERSLTMAAISGTFNMCDPDGTRLQTNLRRLDVLASACRWLGTRIITLCTGTRDPEDMWRWHSDNVRRGTWETLIENMMEACKIADRHEVTLAFEPEVNNVVNSVSKARRLLDEVGSPWLKVVIDPANLPILGDYARLYEVLEEAFDWLGPEIVLAHAKEPNWDHVLSYFTFPRRGRISKSLLENLRHDFFRNYFLHLKGIGYKGAVIMHGLEESEVVSRISSLKANRDVSNWQAESTPLFHRFDRDGIQFHYRDTGRGLPFVFQHGLGGDLNQPFGVYRPIPSMRLIAFDMRGHGETRPLGDLDKLTISGLAEDLIALLDHLEIKQAIVGGISLGAAIAVDVALRFPERVLGLVLSRPAWIDQPLPENVQLYATIARLIRDLGPKEGLYHFRKMAVFQAMERESPDCAKSLIGQFEQPRAEECVARLERLSADTPCPDLAEYRKIGVPTLILGNYQDPIHPFAIAETLSQIIPGAELCKITPKSVSVERHAVDVLKALDAFLSSRFLKSEKPSC
jgi:pimeloyl-ACP methyl ester carboxylesterase/sugar phosphate isomerase/epimerase